MPKKTKILYIVTLSEWGGAQRYIFDLASNLDKNEFEITVAAGEGDEQLFKLLDNLEVKLLKINMKRSISNPSRWLGELFRIYWLIVKEKPDIVHLNSSKTGVIGAFASLLAKVTFLNIGHKLIYTAHGFAFNQPMSNSKRFIYLLAEKISSPFKDKIICVSEFDRQQGIKNKIAKKEKFITIHNGVDINLKFINKDEAKKLLGLNATNVIGTIANFFATKDLLTMIESMAEVRKKFSRATLAIIGDGMMRDDIEKKVSGLSLQDNVKLLGRKNNAYKYLKAFDVYACSSVKEGFPYSILEAMSAELPIVSTNVGGIPEMIKDGYNGFLIEPKNPKLMAEKIILFMTNAQEAQRYGQKARQNAINDFSSQKMLAQTMQTYKS